MADENRVSTQQLKFSVDRAELENSKRQIARLKSDLTSIGDAAKSIAPASKQALKNATDGLADMRAEARKTADAVKNVKGELEQLGKQRAASNDNLGNVSTGLGAAASVIGAGGNNALSEGLRLGGDVTGFLEYVPRLQEGFKNLRSEITDMVSSIGVGNLGMVGAIAAAAIAIKLLSDEAAKVKEKADIAIAAAQDYNRLVLTGTTQTLAEQREAAEQELEVAQQNATEAARLHLELGEAIRQQSGDIGFGIAKINAALGTNNQELKSAEEAYYATQKTLAEAEAAVKNLDRALQSSEVAANDAAAAQERVAKAQAEQAARINDTMLNTLTKSLDMTSESIEKRVAQIEHERAVIQSFIDSGAAQGDQLEQYKKRILDLNVELSTLQMTVAGEVQLREKQNAVEKQAFDVIYGFVKGIPGTIKDVAKDASTVAKGFSEAGEIMRKANVKIAEIATELRENLAKAEAEKSKALVDANREAAQAEIEAVRKANIDIQKLEVEHKQALARIERDFNRSFQQAVGDRNVVAADQARQARDDARADENQNYKNRRNDINRQLEETKRDIAMRLSEQRRVIAERYNEQVADAYAAATKARQIEMQKAQAEAQIKLQAAQQQIQIAQAGAAGVRAAIASIFQGFSGGSTPQQTAGNIGSIIGGLIPGFGSSSATIPNTASGASSFSFSPQIAGQTRRQIRQQVDSRLDNWLTELGYS